MGVIPSGNGTDPWTLMREYIRNQQQSKLMNQQLEERANDRNQRLYMYENQPNQAYATSRATGRANIENSQAAIDAGLDPNAARSGVSRGYGPDSLRKERLANADAFQRGLIDGGVRGPIALASVMGNANIESRFDTRVPGDTNTSMTSYGTMQWRDRFPALKKYAAEQGGAWDDPYIQGRFAAHELQTTERKAGEMLANARNLQEGQLAMNQFLRMKDYDKGAGAIHYERRMQASNEWLKKITGTKEKLETAGGTGRKGSAPTMLTTEAGHRYYPVNMTGKQYSDLEFQHPDAFKRLEYDPTIPMRNGAPGYRQYLDHPSGAPAAPGAVQPQAASSGMVPAAKPTVPSAPPPKLASQTAGPALEADQIEDQSGSDETEEDE